MSPYGVTRPQWVLICVNWNTLLFFPQDITSRHTCYKALKALYRDLRPFIQQGLAKLIKILRRIVHRADCSAQLIPKMFYGVTVGRSWRLLHLCDIALHDEEWRCHLDSGSCPRNNAWQMALRCFAKCPYRAHRWDIRQGAQEGIWRYCGKLPIRGPNTTRLDPMSLAPWPEALTR